MMRTSQDPPPSPRRGDAPLSTATLRRLNLFFIFSIARSPIPTSRIVEDSDLGYGRALRKSECKKFERDRRELARRGIYINKVKTEGAVATEEVFWELDRTKQKDPLSSLTNDELDHLLRETNRMRTNPFWKSNEALAELHASLMLELASRRGTALPRIVTIDDAQPDNPVPPELWDHLQSLTSLGFRYRNSQGTVRHHTVDLYGLFQQEDELYFVGREHESGRIKTFRCNRIEQIDDEKGLPYHIPESFILADYLFLPFDFSSETAREAVFRFPPTVSELEIESLSHGRGTIVHGSTPPCIELHIEVRDLDSAATWALSHSSLTMVPVSPQELVDIWKNHIERAVAAHEG